MLQFVPITKDSVSLIAPYLYENVGRLCDFTVVNLYLWAGYFYKAYALEEDMLYLQLLTEDDTVAYAVPRGSGDREEALRRLKQYADSTGEKWMFSLVCDEELALLRRVFGDDITVTSAREWCDYVYDAKAMASYTGSAYAKQRNHKRRFERLYPAYRAERLTQEHIPAVCAFLQRFSDIRSKEENALAEQEIAVAQTALLRMEDIGLFGVVLYVEDTLVGFSAGSRSADTLYVHFEKADTAFDGVYQMLVYVFASMFVDEDIVCINREEDCGDEGLRRSKLAYHPIALLEKYNVDLNG